MDIKEYHLPENIAAISSKEKKDLVDRYFDTVRQVGVLADNVVDLILMALDIDPYTHPDISFKNFNDITIDDYDTSFELKRCNDDYDVTPEQAQKLFDLGFDQFWLCFKNGKEKYYSSPVLAARVLKNLEKNGQ